MSDQLPLCECGAPLVSAGAIRGWYCSSDACGFGYHRIPVATPGAIATREDSLPQLDESFRSQGLLDEIEELKRITLTTAQTRDDYRADYFRVHGDYMDFKYPGSRRKDRPWTGAQISVALKSHADAISELMNELAKLSSEVKKKVGE